MYHVIIHYLSCISSVVLDHILYSTCTAEASSGFVSNNHDLSAKRCESGND